MLPVSPPAESRRLDSAVSVSPSGWDSVCVLWSTDAALSGHGEPDKQPPEITLLYYAQHVYMQAVVWLSSILKSQQGI